MAIADEEISSFFNDVVGVTKSQGQQPTEVVFEANADASPYIITKPLHSSQRVLETTEGGYTVFCINVVLNFELERELMGFGATIKVLKPTFLVRRFASQTKKMAELYERK
jgi:hypothetical protein